ncbi:sugar phosphate permease [Desulfosporosinus orientis DSM 765]|uniref:Sugar phosphate permease n=1 Tax=Desulfosporosinus orientis (strain ATCC 19365 / DSM 765 / NCIMB 8382 / VKM B-1628 / Singapore I) TaxID=768706 RepID=G7WFC3_DESOD|nr:MFS transporter [Desulfosporosinus orientis]AET68009.1 sugar phosphate permease [Desulfosporosinus orientis DSM 765]
MGRYGVLGLLLIINIFNYIDRNALAGVSPLLKTAFQLNDATIGLLGSAFLLTYTLVAVPFGIWSDLWKPQKVAAIGILIWSLACVLTSTSTSETQLFIWRSLVGVGEAAYVATAGTIISKRFDSGQRSKMLGVFNLGLPLGAALGVVLGGMIGERLGWGAVFVIVGVPGFLLAVMAWLIRDYTPMQNPVAGFPPTEVKDKEGFDWLKLKGTLKLPYLLVVLGYIGISYCFGAVINFLPLYLTRIMHFSLGKAATKSGIIIVLAGLLGAPIGGWIADRWYVRYRGGRGFTLLLACLVSAILMWLGIGLQSTLLFGLAAFFMLWHVGVAAAMVFDTTQRLVWNSATAIAMLFMHLLGDVPSSAITGLISDQYGLVMAFNFLPVAMLIGGIAFGLSGYLQAKSEGSTY